MKAGPRERSEDTAGPHSGAPRRLLLYGASVALLLALCIPFVAPSFPGPFPVDPRYARLPDGVSISAHAKAWASNRPEEAFRWACNLEKPSDRETALTSVWEVWPKVDPASAAGNVASVSDEPFRKSLIVSIAREWVTRDPDAAINWASRLPPGAAPSDLMYQIAEFWADKDPKRAADFAVTLANNETSEEYSAVQVVISRWMTQDSQSVARWLLELKNKQAAMNGMMQLMRHWAAHKPVEAGRWLETMPAKTPFEVELRFYAAEVYLEVATELAPESAAMIALKFAGKNSRPSEVAKVLSCWFAADADSARRWIRECGLPRSLALPEGRAAYLKMLGCCNTPEAKTATALLETAAIAQLQKSR